MAVVGHVLLWFLAAVGVVMIIAIVIAGIDQAKTPTVEAPKPPVQITNLRTLPRTEPEIDPHQPQVLQKTTMQITTTKYIDPNASPPKELSA